MQILQLLIFFPSILVWLHNNQLTGSLPTQIGLLSSVTRVRLFNNKLVGQVPTEIGNLRKIEVVEINSNRLSSTLPDVFDSLTYLYRFHAYDDSFTGEIPPSIWRADSLSSLRLQNNNLNGSVPYDYCDKMSELGLDDSGWFIDSPKVDCDCCDKSCQFWDTILNPTGTNTKCPDEYILYLFHEFGILTSYMKDVHTNDTINGYYEGICSSPTGCYEVKGRDGNDNLKDKEWYFGYSNTSRSIIESNPKNPICDAVEICDKVINSNHPKRKIINFFMKTLISNSSILYDSESYENKALCWIIEHEDTHDLDECDGTLFQFCIMGLFFSSTNYFESGNLFSSTGRLCDLDGIECDEKNKFIEAINFQNKNITGSLNTQIGLLQSLIKIDLSNNEMKGTINDATFNGKLPNLEIFDVNSNSFEGKIPTTLLSLPSLKELNISSNLFVGTLPASIPYSSTLGTL